MIFSLEEIKYLKEITQLCNFIDFDSKENILYFNIDFILFYFKLKKRKNIYFKSTQYFSLSIKGKDVKISKIIESKIESILRVIKSLEKNYFFINNVKILYYLIILIIRFPKYFSKIIKLLENTCSIQHYKTLTLQDFQFILFSKQNIELNSFIKNKNKIKDDFIRQKNNELFQLPHIFIIGDARSGTRWLKEIIKQILKQSNKQYININDTITNIDFKTNNEYKRGQNNMVSFIKYQNLFYNHKELRRLKSKLLYISQLPYTIFKNTINFDPVFFKLFIPDNFVILTKITYELYQSIKNHFTNANFFIIQRDPRDIYLSQKAYFKDKLSINFDQIIKDQIKLNKIKNSKSVIKIKYENLLNDTMQEILTISNNLNIKIENNYMNKIIKSTSFKFMSGRDYGKLKNGDYFRGGSNWRIEMSKDEINNINSKYKAELLYLDYPLE